MVEQQANELKQVIEFLDSKDARKAALEIILGFTTTPENRQLFKGLDLCKKCLRLVIDPEVTLDVKAACFKVLINMASDASYVDECVELNAARKVFDFLMNNVKQDLEEVGSDTKIVEETSDGQKVAADALQTPEQAKSE